MKTDPKCAACLILAAAVLPLFAAEETGAVPDGKIQKIRFVEDDAQNYFVSKIYELKNRKANDVVPFLLGSVRRYANNGSADRINYAAGKKQLVAVSCPAPLIPYLDDMVEKLDRPCAPGPDGSAIEGTGIVRSVYAPVWRSGETMMEIMIKTGIPSNAAEGANQDAVVAYDKPSNRIYWKDSIRKNDDMKKYLSWLDRPVPQVNLTWKVYEIRESDLLDLGLDYPAWKNGPGLNLFEAGASFLENSAMESAFGPYGFFMFAPAFDLSFVRILQQNGRAAVSTGASVTVANGRGATVRFEPGYQNLEKDGKFASSVAVSPNDSLSLSVSNPVVALSGKTDPASGRLGFSPEDLARQTGTVNFSYTLDRKNTVERDNHGNELYEFSSSEGASTIRTGGERMLAKWIREQDVEQTIGVPFLCELPVLKYIFGTTTRTKEKLYCVLTVRAELVHPDSDIAAASGKFLSVSELLNSSEKVEK